MDALGDYLKEAREKLNLSIEKISEDTRIMSKFIEAIEKEEFTAFPGEAYLVGFLKSYSEYLGIDGEDVVRRYERIKMAEAPTPLEQLIPKPKFNPLPLIMIAVAVIVVIGLGFGAFFGVKSIIASAKERKANEGTSEQIAETYQQKREAKKEEQRKQTEAEVVKEDITTLTNPITQLNKVKKDAIIKLMINEKESALKIKQLSPTVVITYGEGQDLYVIKDTAHKVDLNNDGKNDLELILNSWDKDFAEFTFKTIDQTVVSTAKLGTYELIGENPEVLITKDAPEDISIVVTFNKSQQFFRYKCDENAAVEGIYGDREDNKSLSVKAKSYMVVWFTYADDATISFPKFDNQVFNYSNKNRVEISLIKWERNSEGKYELVISSLK